MIEKEIKYKVTEEQFLSLQQDFSNECEEFYTEINYIFSSPALEEGTVLRVRELTTHDFFGGFDSPVTTYLITYKGKATVDSDGFKSREESELTVKDNPIALFEKLGYTVTLVYEKRRREIILNPFTDEDSQLVQFDELPFGFYIETENVKVEEFSKLEVEKLSYPELTIKHGEALLGVTWAKFSE